MDHITGEKDIHAKQKMAVREISTSCQNDLNRAKREVFDAISNEINAFKGFTFESIGTSGVMLPGESFETDLPSSQIDAMSP